MRHLFILFSGYVLSPRRVAIWDRAIFFEIRFKFFFSHTSPDLMDTVEPKAKHVVILLVGIKREPCELPKPK